MPQSEQNTSELQLYKKLFHSSHTMIAIVKDKNMIIDIANEAILAAWGKGNDVFGKSVFEVLPEIIPQGFVEILEKVYTTGQTFTANEMPLNLIINGKTELRHYTFTYEALYGTGKQIIGIGIIANEVTSQTLIHQKIRESELLFRMIAEQMPEKVTNATPEGNVTYYNKSWQDYTGASFEELVRNGWQPWMHHDEVADILKNWQHALATGENFEMEIRMLDRNGKYRWHSSKAKAIKDIDNKILLWIGFNTDIDEHKKNEANLTLLVANRTQALEMANKKLKQKNKEISNSKEKLLSEYSRSLIEASLDPLITISIKGKIMDMNQAMMNATGKSRQELIGSDFFNYFTDTQKAKEVYQAVFANGFVINYPLTIKDHKLTDVLFNGSVYKNEEGKVLGAVVVARDITEQKRISTELTLAKTAAENAVKAKQQFLSNMSHEIRTPMNAIIGFTKVILKTDLSAKQKEYLMAIKMSGDSLIVLINDILDLAKVDAGKMSFEQSPFKMEMSIGAMLHLFETKIQEKNLVLIKNYDSRIPDVLLGDSVRLHQVIMNLLSNAVKFTHKGSIEVSVELLAQNTEQVTIQFSVTDTGIGISPDKIDSIFENFQQATSKTARLFGGTGLGLAIVKQLVEPQGGVITVKSEIGVGSTFSFVLDFQKTKEDVEVETIILELDSNLKNIKVLVVEDMALNQLLMKTLLDDFGFECDIAANGKIAIDKLSQATDNNHYDIVLMDLQMPEMNGFEATEHIRNVLKSQIPIIALTADVTTVDEDKCRAVGMNDYIAKPVDERLLYSKIVSLIQKTPISTAPEGIKKVRRIDLDYLSQRTKNNPALMAEMITLYLEQTPPLVVAMKQSLYDKNWGLLQSAVHKMIPSFAIMGISGDYENMAKKVQEFAKTQLVADEINDLVQQLESVCSQACEELLEELKRIKNTMP
jgi:PAS domain S-box-containing protein